MWHVHQGGRDRFRVSLGLFAPVAWFNAGKGCALLLDGSKGWEQGAETRFYIYQNLKKRLPGKQSKNRQLVGLDDDR
jgi:hypothetical protein